MTDESKMRRPASRWSAILALVVLWSGVGWAQLQVGEDLKMSLNGSVGLGYGGVTGSTGDVESSGHSTSFNGSGNLSGSYYHPNFLSFMVQPYYNRSASNAATDSVLSSTGFSATVNLFSGSRFPGSISYSRQYSGSSEFGIPGTEGLSTSGSGQAFTITWGAFVPKWPTLTASFSTGGNSSRLLGTNSESSSSSKSFNLHSTYTLKGWALNAYLNRQTLSLELPAFLTGRQYWSGSGATTMGVSASHRLPMSGSFSANWSHSSFGSGDVARSEGASTSLSTVATVSPTRKLTVSGDLRYTSNLMAAIQQSVSPVGPTVLRPDRNSSALGFGGFANYALTRGVMLRGYVNHRRQAYYGRELSDTSYGGTVNLNYSRPLLGLLYFSFGLVNTANETGNNSLGFIGTVSLNRKFGRWETTADFSYSQNVQTQLATFTTSSYRTGGYVRRRLTRDLYWNGSFRTAHSALTRREGEGNHSYSMTTGASWKRYTLTGAYSFSRGTTVLSQTGLLNPEPLPGFLDENQVLYNGRSFSIGLAGRPLRRMSLTVYYTRANSDTTSFAAFSRNQRERYNARMEYRVRQLSVGAGFTRDHQGISASGAPPSVVNSYYIGISRWFNVF